MAKLVMLVQLAIVGLACVVCVAQAAPTTDKPVLDFPVLCDTCQAVVVQVQANLEQMRPKLDQLCNYCGSPENNQKCLNKLHEFEDMLEHEKPRDVCEKMGLCHKPHDYFVDFTGQF